MREEKRGISILSITIFVIRVIGARRDNIRLLVFIKIRKLQYWFLNLNGNRGRILKATAIKNVDIFLITSFSFANKDPIGDK